MTTAQFFGKGPLFEAHAGGAARRRPQRTASRAAVDAMTAMLEPIMMVGLGGTVGALLIAMYLPIFKIAETIG